MAALASLVTGRSGSHPNHGPTTSHELTSQPDHSFGAGHDKARQSIQGTEEHSIYNGIVVTQDTAHESLRLHAKCNRPFPVALRLKSDPCQSPAAK